MSFELDVPRTGFGVHAENNRIYIFGGEIKDGDYPVADVTSINILNGRIEKLTPMPQRLRTARSSVVF